jgi:hypothetical protein
MPQGPGARRAAAYRAAGDGGQGVGLDAHGYRIWPRMGRAKSSDHPDRFRLRRMEMSGRAEGSTLRASLRRMARFCVAVVVLLRLHVRADILGRHQPHFVALRGQEPTKVVRAAARLHRHHAARLLRQQCGDALAAEPPAKHNAP